MKIKYLKPSQIITLNDYPVYNEQILKLYFRMFRIGHKNHVPPCPIISKKLVIQKLDGKMKKLFKSFELKHPEAQYFLLDGSHKTTAAALFNRKIQVIIFESDEDIKKAERMVEEGHLFSLPVGKTIDLLIKALTTHFNKTKKFQTIKEKTDRMIKDKILPKYMIR